MRFLRVAGGAENKQADARYKRLQHTRPGRTTRPLPSPTCRDGMAERCLPDSHGHSCKAIDALHTPMDNVAHAHGQRCTRPWTTLHTAVDNARSLFLKRGYSLDRRKAFYLDSFEMSKSQQLGNNCAECYSIAIHFYELSHDDEVS